MRGIVFFLLIFNVLIFAWFMFQQDQEQQILDRDERAAFDYSHVEKLTLLQELPKSTLLERDLRRKAALEEQRRKEEEAQLMCGLIGPFPEVVTAKQIRGRLGGKVENAPIVMIAKTLPSVHWIFIPPLDDRKAALAMIKRLQGDGVDSFLMTESESGYENAISLGVYSKLESAQKVLEGIIAKGYPAELTKKLRQKEAYWLVLDVDSTLDFDTAELEAFRVEIPEIKKQEKSCQSIAVLQTFE
jgi:hypothetical protein